MQKRQSLTWQWIPTYLTLAGQLDMSVVHGDGTTTAAKKGGNNLGFSGHKKMKGDKIVAFCDRRCNVIAPFVSASGNHNESPLLRFERIRELYYALKSLAYTMINLRHFCQR